MRTGSGDLGAVVSFTLESVVRRPVLREQLRLLQHRAGRLVLLARRVVVLIFGPMLAVGLIVDMLWPQALRLYIIAVGVVWIVSLIAYLVVGSRRTQPRGPGEGS